MKIGNKTSFFHMFISSTLSLIMLISLLPSKSVYAKETDYSEPLSQIHVTETADGFLFEERTVIPQVSSYSSLYSHTIDGVEEIKTTLVIPHTEQYRKELAATLATESGEATLTPDEVVDPSLSMSIHISAVFRFQDVGVQ